MPDENLSPEQITQLGFELEQAGRIADARALFTVAAQRGEAQAMYNLGVLAQRLGEVQEACRWFQAAHEAGHPEAATNLGVVLYGAMDWSGSEYWLRIGADAGNQYAVQNLQALRVGVAQLAGRMPAEQLIELLRLWAEEHLRRFESGGDLVSLDLAVDKAREAAAAARGDALHADCLAELRDVLRARIDQTEQRADLDEAIEVGRVVLADATTRGIDHPTDVFTLAVLLRLRYVRAGQPADLDEAVTICRQSGGVQDPKVLSTLSSVLSTRFERTADPADIDAAVGAGRRAVTLPTDAAATAVALSGLGSTLLLRFHYTGDAADLDEAISFLMEAASTGPQNHAATLANLATALASRAALTGRQTDTAGADRATAQAIEEISAAQPRLRRHLSFTAVSHMDAAGAVDQARAVVARTPAGDPGRHLMLIALGEALTRAGDLDGAIRVLSEAWETAPEGHVDKASAGERLAGALHARYEHAHVRADLDRGIGLLRAAVAITPASHPAHAEHWLKLGGMLVSRFNAEDHAAANQLPDRPVEDPAVNSAEDPATAPTSPQPADITEALLTFRTAADSPAGLPSTRMLAARAWASIAAERRLDLDALNGASTAVSLMPILAWHGLDLDTRRRNLADAAAMPREAAACAIRCGELERAVELLEQGRSLMWAQLLHQRTDLDALAAVAPDLADRLNRTRSVLSDPRPADTEDRMRSARQWDELVGQVRALDGYQHFLAATPFAELAGAAREGPVVIVNVSTIRCDALIVMPSTEVVVVPLPKVTAKQADAVANRYLTDLTAAGQPGASFLDREQARHTLHDTLEWLWDAIAEPVITALGYPHAPEPDRTLPRMWWCPTASLTMLPLHAAGHHPRTSKTRATADEPSLLSAVVSSYTPTLCALLRARQAEASPKATMLAVGMPALPGGRGPLPASRAELAAVAAHFPGQTVEITAEAATRDAVSRLLTTHSWAHFSCHGRADLADPSRSALVLWDGPLTVLDLAEQHLDRADLAFLSACHTAAGGTRLPDEAVHLAAAVQLAGFRHVVATLWTIEDSPAPDFADTAYRVMAETETGQPDADRAARAVHAASVRLRLGHPADPAVWAPYVHIGP
jgi:TPR repeat protein